MKGLSVFLPTGFICFVFSLAGCHHTPEHTDRLLESAWTPVTKSAEKGLSHQRAYCYSTLGDPECYRKRKEKLDSRLKGYYEPEKKVQPPSQNEKMDDYTDRGIDV